MWFLQLGRVPVLIPAFLDIQKLCGDGGYLYPRPLFTSVTLWSNDQTTLPAMDAPFKQQTQGGEAETGKRNNQDEGSNAISLLLQRFVPFIQSSAGRLNWRNVSLTWCFHWHTQRSVLWASILFFKLNCTVNTVIMVPQSNLKCYCNLGYSNYCIISTTKQPGFVNWLNFSWFCSFPRFIRLRSEIISLYVCFYLCLLLNYDRESALRGLFYFESWLEALWWNVCLTSWLVWFAHSYSWHSGVESSFWNAVRLLIID